MADKLAKIYGRDILGSGDGFRFPKPGRSGDFLDGRCHDRLDFEEWIIDWEVEFPDDEHIKYVKDDLGKFCTETPCSLSLDLVFMRWEYCQSKQARTV